MEKICTSHREEVRGGSRKPDGENLRNVDEVNGAW